MVQLFYGLLLLGTASECFGVKPTRYGHVRASRRGFKGRTHFRRIHNADSQEVDDKHYYDGEPIPEVTEPYDTDYYPGPVEYYTDTESSKSEEDGTITTQKPAPEALWSPPIGISLYDQINMHDDFEDKLTREAWAAMPNQEKLEEDKQNSSQYWSMHMLMQEQQEYRDWYTSPLKSGYATYACYHIASTFLHAKKALPEYYRIRYAYYEKRDFELGYLVHEITYKYTVLLELFHQVQSRFYNRSRFEYIATSSYMVYMYGAMVGISQTIMHLCNMLGQVDSKYGAQINEMPDYYDTDLENAKKAHKAKLAAGGAGNPYEDLYMDEMEKQRLRRKKLRQQRKKELEAMKKSGIYSSTRHTRRPRSFDHFPLHYGWSVEYW